jgi:hypothetical protein
MTWSFAQARQAAADVRAAPLGSRAVATMRPRGVVGLVRSRAPLSVLLFVAARDGLVTEQDNGGYAVLQRPSASPPVRSGGTGCACCAGWTAAGTLSCSAGRRCSAW